jgi:hypothetical protein
MDRVVSRDLSAFFKLKRRDSLDRYTGRAETLGSLLVDMEAKDSPSSLTLR